MWFRIEFNRDGSVKEAREAEARGTDAGGLVTYIDTDTKLKAVREAIAWRAKYLENARLHRREQVKKSERLGICRECLGRKAVAGKRFCQPCRDAITARRNVPHVITHNAPALDVKVVTKKIAEIYGKRRVAEPVVASLLQGNGSSCANATQVARAIRGLGFVASANKVDAKRGGGGRHTVSDIELAILLAVRDARSKMSRAEFDSWLDSEISNRRAAASEAA